MSRRENSLTRWFINSILIPKKQPVFILMVQLKDLKVNAWLFNLLKLHVIVAVFYKVFKIQLRQITVQLPTHQGLQSIVFNMF